MPFAVETDRSGLSNPGGHRSFVRTFRICGNDKIEEDDLSRGWIDQTAILRSSNLPQIGDPHPQDPFARCLDRLLVSWPLREIRCVYSTMTLSALNT